MIEKNKYSESEIEEYFKYIKMIAYFKNIEEDKINV